MLKIIENQINDLEISADVETLSQWFKYDDMTCKQAALMLLVQDNPGCTVATLAAALKTNKPSVTRACDKFEKMGFIRRKTDYQDRRLVRIFATGKKL